MRFDEGMGNRQANAASASALTGTGFIHAVKAVEDVR